MRLPLLAAVASVLLAVALVAVFVIEGSVLAAAQAADSAADVLVALGLAAAVMIGRRPADSDHHYGHGQAEPVAALVAAFVAAQLGIEVVQAAIEALRGAPLQVLSLWVAIVFAAKVAVKLVVAALAHRRRAESPVLDALAVDARNDVLVGAVALLGYVAVNRGYGRVDAVLALGVGALVVISALGLALRSIKLLMGEAPPTERLERLRETAANVDGVVELDELRARLTGNGIEVSLCIGVPEWLSVADAHDVADAVEIELQSDDDVSTAEVHVHPATIASAPDEGGDAKT